MKRTDSSPAGARAAAAEVPPGGRRPLDVPDAPGGAPPSPGPATPGTPPGATPPEATADATPERAAPEQTTREGNEDRRPRGVLSLRGLLAWCAFIAFVLHTLAVLYTWYAWRDLPGGRSWWVVVTDLPVSLLYAHFTHELLLLWSLTLGGLQWALTGALVAWLVWRVTTVRKRRRRSS